MNPRLLIKAAVVVALAGMTALAQQGTAPEDKAAKAKERLAQLQQRLKLSPEQIEKLKPIVQKEVEELRAVKEKYGADTSRRGKMTMARELKKVQGKYEPQIGEVLTPEQMAEWKKIKQERKEEIKKQRQG